MTMTHTITLDAIDWSAQFGGAKRYLFHASGEAVQALDSDATAQKHQESRSKAATVVLGDRRIVGRLYSTDYKGGRFIADSDLDHKVLVAHSRKHGHSAFQVQVEVA